MNQLTESVQDNSYFPFSEAIWTAKNSRRKILAALSAVSAIGKARLQFKVIGSSLSCQKAWGKGEPANQWHAAGCRLQPCKCFAGLLFWLGERGRGKEHWPIWAIQNNGGKAERLSSLTLFPHY